MSVTNGMRCRRRAWLTAGAAGALVALMLLFVSMLTVPSALIIGAAVCGGLGTFIGWAFCPPGMRTAAAGGEVAGEAEHPAPRPSAPARPAPRAAETGGAPAPAPAPTPAPPADGPRASAPAVSPAVPRPARSEAGVNLDAALAKSRGEAAPAETYHPPPEMLAQPRGGQADDLKLIRGIGPRLEEILNAAGVWHFDQIAAWKARDIAFVDEKLVGFHGRITRDEWVKQARILARGETTDFAERARKGEHEREAQ